MAFDDKPAPAKQQICNLLIIIFSGIACALLISGFLLYYYGPTGSYLAQNTVLSPAVSEILRYQDVDGNTRGRARFVFDGIEFSYYDSKDNQWHQKTVDQPQYRKIYELIQNDKSLEVPSAVKTFFNETNMVSLIIKVRPENGQQETRIFQTINFVNDGDYYRVQLREANSKDQWAYFYHPHITQDLFVLMQIH